MDLIEHRVRERAYYIWEDEGRVHGRADAHWLRAESEFAAPAKAAILTVEAVAEASLAPSPAKTLKKAIRAKAAEAKPAKAAAPKATVAKVTAAKAPKALAAVGLAKAKAARTAATSAGLH